MSSPDSEAQPPLEVTLREVKELVRTFKASGWASLELDFRGMHIVLGRDGPPAAPSPRYDAPVPLAPDGPAPKSLQVAPALPAPDGPARAAAAPVPGPVGESQAATDAPAARMVEVRSPAVGAFWVAPGPGQPPFVEVGQRVVADQQLAIIEVMKLMNNVSSPVAGQVVQVCAVNSDLVEFDQLLFLIEPEDG